MAPAVLGVRGGVGSCGIAPPPTPCSYKFLEKNCAMFFVEVHVALTLCMVNI